VLLLHKGALTTAICRELRQNRASSPSAWQEQTRTVVARRHDTDCFCQLFLLLYGALDFLRVSPCFTGREQRIKGGRKKMAIVLHDLRVAFVNYLSTKVTVSVGFFPQLDITIT
jgi:hypothetical protein